jgi:heme exporter protein B
MSAIRVLLKRELSLAWGGGGGPLLACGFFLALTAIVPLAAGSDPRVLRPVAGGIAWVALALASLLSLERLFERDFEDGALDILTLGPLPLEAVFAVKALAQWLATGLPLGLAAPIAAVALGADPIHAPLILLSALLGGLVFAFTGALGAALALGSRRGGLLIAVVVLPLFIPSVIFGAGALEQTLSGLSPWPALALLAAYALFGAALSPLAGAAAIRNAQG